MISRILFLSSALLLGGCSVMHFQNGTVQPEGRTVDRWHHNAALSLYEVSAPLNMETLCADKKWARVTTQETFVTGLAGSISYGLWDPQIATYTCGAK